MKVKLITAACLMAIGSVSFAGNGPPRDGPRHWYTAYVSCNNVDVIDAAQICGSFFPAGNDNCKAVFDNLQGKKIPCATGISTALTVQDEICRGRWESSYIHDTSNIQGASGTKHIASGYCYREDFD